MTWIAVVHDLVDKLRELALHGDAAATKKVEDHDKFHRAGDFAASLKFERDLLKTAKDDFELISESEFADLQRIQADRHRCAHPSLSVDGEPFAPTAELARVHIRAAIEHLLRREPAQGRYALEMILKQVKGDYFPLNSEKAAEVLSHGPLLRGRESLVRSLIVVLIKDLLRETLDFNSQRKFRHCLRFIKDKRRDVWDRHFAAELARISRTLDPAARAPHMLALCRVEGVWDAYPRDIQTTLRMFVERLPKENLDLLEELYDNNVITDSCDLRVRRLTAEEANDTLWYEAPDAVWKKSIEEFVSAGNFAEANAWALEIHSSHLKKKNHRMTADEAERICRAVIDNRQVRQCNRRDSVLACVLAAGLTGGSWNEMVEAAEIDLDEVRAVEM